MFDLSNTCLKKGCLAGEVAIVTGSTSNVGRGYAQALAWAGAKVVVVGRSEARGAEVADTINADNGPDTAIFVKTDVSSAEDVANLKAKAYEKFGKVDILINNAMDMALNGPILESPVEDLDKAYAISARAVMLAAQAFVPDMVKRGHGAVCYSTTQFHYIPGMLGGSVYTAAKAAATSAMMSLAYEVQDSGVNVFCLAPAGVGAVNPASQKVLTEEMKNMRMPGFPGMIPADAAGAGLVWLLLHGKEMHATGTMIGDVLVDMGYPFPCPETLRDYPRAYVGGMQLTLLPCYMGHGFPEK
ncbi:MAG: SDR family oxidoreductase [Ruminococcaceae bacterium]|jgi:NAD(P)-dependent dehydrogenase (short-subunit alcohol dehydrogenase family)|nr:SDR family oxidoreductase [Oscillospiraceae bacterium]